jgi:hypothetical protein
VRRAGTLSIAAAASLGAVFFACNGVLGIHEASLEPPEGGAEAGSGDGGSLVSYELSCDSYCRVIAANCKPSSLEDDTEYLSPAVCSQLCAQYESTPTPLDPNTEPTPGDTLNCRVWHANAAALGPHTHCPHSGPLGGNLCDDSQLGGPCKAFCTLNLAVCTGDAAAYPSMTDCLNACEADAGYPGFPYQNMPGDPEVRDLQTSGNTLNCRMYHLENFLFTGEALHCSHTTQSGNGVCSN